MNSLADKLAAFFLARPNRWIDGRTLADVAGQYAWRTRVADVRKPPYELTIANRQRRVKTERGGTFTVSEYMCVVEEVRVEKKKADATSEVIASAPLLF